MKTIFPSTSYRNYTICWPNHWGNAGKIRKRKIHSTFHSKDISSKWMKSAICSKQCVKIIRSPQRFVHITDIISFNSARKKRLPFHIMPAVSAVSQVALRRWHIIASEWHYLQTIQTSFYWSQFFLIDLHSWIWRKKKLMYVWNEWVLESMHAVTSRSRCFFSSVGVLHQFTPPYTRSLFKEHFQVNIGKSA